MKSFICLGLTAFFIAFVIARVPDGPDKIACFWNSTSSLGFMSILLYFIINLFLLLLFHNISGFISF